MPLCHLFTNIAASALRQGIETRLAHLISATLNKPLERVSVVVVPGVHVFRHGSTAPACTINLSATERFNKESNPMYTEPLVKAVTKELGISRERVLLIYQDLNKNMLGSTLPPQ